MTNILSPTKRIEDLDGIKFVLILFVIIGHFSEPFRYTSDLIGTIYTILYMFHMPLFIMLSGFFSKKITFKSLQKRILFLGETYIVMSLSAIIVLSNGSIKWLFIPATSYWYLMSLIEWNCLHLILTKITPPGIMC